MRDQDVGAGETGLPEFQIIAPGQPVGELLAKHGAIAVNDIHHVSFGLFEICHAVAPRRIAPTISYGLIIWVVLQGEIMRNIGVEQGGALRV